MLKFTSLTIVGLLLVGASSCTSGSDTKREPPVVESAEPPSPSTFEDDVAKTAEPPTPSEPSPTPAMPAPAMPATEPEVDPTVADQIVANVTGVTSSGTSLAVSIASDETGCERYANWWEVIDDDGTLIYRRILGHSHVSEQPFTRSGGPVEVERDQHITIRAYLHEGEGGRYGGAEFEGSIASGFSASTTVANVPAAVEFAAPQPDGCAF